MTTNTPDMEEERLKLARFVVLLAPDVVPFPRSYACALCYPHDTFGPTTPVEAIDGFVCPYHLALEIVGLES